METFEYLMGMFCR